jgi:hypothetical protein
MFAWIAALPLLGSIVQAKQKKSPIESDPISWMLTNLHNQFYKVTGKTPKKIVLGKDLFDKFAGEIKTMQRFVDDKDYVAPAQQTMAFKTCRVYSSDKAGWFVNSME